MDVSVQGDGAEVEDRGCRAHDIKGDPSVAELRTEWPVAEEVIDNSKGHD